MTETSWWITAVAIGLYVPIGGWFLRTLVLRTKQLGPDEFGVRHAMITTVICLVTLLPILGLAQIFPSFARGLRAFITTGVWMLIVRWRYDTTWLATVLITIFHRAVLVVLLLGMARLATLL